MLTILENCFDFDKYLGSLDDDELNEFIYNP